jgi:hypothetical protein
MFALGTRDGFEEGQFIGKPMLVFALPADGPAEGFSLMAGEL